MNLESQVCSLEFAKRLKELGVKQESLYYWHEIKYPDSDFKRVKLDEGYKPIDGQTFNAFTVAELGEILPPTINTWGLAINASSCATYNGIKSRWAITYADYDKKLMDEFTGLKLVDVMSKMLIYLLKNKLMELTDE